MKESNDESTQDSKCPHFQKIIQSSPSIQSFSFVKPSLKGWICLKDGCSKKQGNHTTMKQQLNKFEADHKVFMEMSRFEIYCFECGLEITDSSEQLTPQIRKLAIQIDQEQQKMLFGSSIQYPPGFQKDKAGIAGTVGSQFSSFINAAIQLLAHVPPFYQICQDIDFKTVRDPCLLQTLKCITKIRSGVYRIVDTRQVQKQLLAHFTHFTNYSLKTPANFIYEILRSFSLQFEYKGISCEPGKIIQSPIKKSSPSMFEVYSPMKQLFAGQFIWHLKCDSCKLQKVKKAQFECLRLEHEQKALLKSNKSLEQMIENIFNFEKLFKNTFSNPQVLSCRQIENCSNMKLIQGKSHAKMPNILLLQFLFEDGVSMECPDVLDLTKYANTANQQYRYYYIGSVGRNNKKYYTHVKEPNGREYIFEDCLIKEQAKRVGKVVNAVYKLQPKQKNKDLYKNIESSILVNIQCYIPLPDFWTFYLLDLRRVQPLINPFICRHGFLAPQIRSKSSVVRKIPFPIYQFLVESFGGVAVKASKEEDYCQICLQEIKIMNELKNSEKQMAKFADQLSNKKSKVCVDLKWFEQWRKYLYQAPIEPYGKQIYKRPKAIDNKAGLNADGEIDQVKYKKISQEVWYFFKKFYGGGPLIAKNPLPPSLALTQAIDLRYDKIKSLIKKLQGLQEL